MIKALLLWSCLSVPQDGQWHRCFVVTTEVDAYDVSEIRNGHFHYRVWFQSVDARWHVFTEIADDPPEVIKSWRYRLAR